MDGCYECKCNGSEQSDKSAIKYQSDVDELDQSSADGGVYGDANIRCAG